MFSMFARRYDREGDNQFGTASDVKLRHAVTGQFAVDAATVQEFKTFVKAQMPNTYDEAGFNADVEFIKAMIRFDIDNAVFSVADARRHLITVDPQAQSGLTMFGEAQKLTELSKGSKTKAH